MSIGCAEQTHHNSSAQRDSSAFAKTHEDSTNQTIAGRKDGVWLVRHPNGQLKSEGRYQADLKEGIHKSWEDDGTLIEEVEFLHGKETGLTTWYHPGGHVAGSGQMINGVRQGPWKICDIAENGFCIEAHFKNGKRDGVWKIYHDASNEKLWKEQTFKDDRVIAEKCWDENGILIACE